MAMENFFTLIYKMICHPHVERSEKNKSKLLESFYFPTTWIG
jgi:hypothetical protein